MAGNVRQNQKVEKYLGMEVHPLVRHYPWMSNTEELQEWPRFVESIRNAGGVMDPIVVYEGKILDGRHRARAVDEIRKEIPEFPEPPQEQWEKGKHGNSPEEFVEQRNAVRNHWNQDQRAVWAVRKCWVPEEQAAKDRKEQSQYGCTVTPKGVSPIGSEGSRRSNTTQHRVARKANVGESLIAKVRRVREEHGEGALDEVFAGKRRLADYPISRQKKKPPVTPPETVGSAVGKKGRKKGKAAAEQEQEDYETQELIEEGEDYLRRALDCFYGFDDELLVAALDEVFGDWVAIAKRGGA